MRYAEYEGAVAVQRRPERRAVDLIREAARTDRYWILHPEPAGTWTLRQLDGATGLLGDPVHESDRFGPDADQALAWAGDLVDVTGWQSMSRPYPGAFVDEVYGLVRDLRPHASRSSERGRQA